MMTRSDFDVYADPVNYDRESSHFDPDGTILLKEASRVSGRVLELGCGTGRVTIPLAERGIKVTGLDASPQMIEHARAKAGNLSIEWVHDDVRSFHHDSRFSLVFTYGLVFQHLLTRADQEAMFAQVQKHLAPGGTFILDAMFKHPASMVDVPEEQHWYTYSNDQGREVQVSGTDHYDHLRQLWIQTLNRGWLDADGTPQIRTEKLALRFLMPQEMETLLFYNGFEVLSRYVDWQGNPFTEDSNLQIFVCAPRIRPDPGGT